MSRYIGLFVAEASEHLAKLGSELVRLEGAAREGADLAPIVDGLFRHAHSVKGMSASMQFEGIAALAHRVEDLVAAFRQRAAAPDAGAGGPRPPRGRARRGRPRGTRRRALIRRAPMGRAPPAQNRPPASPSSTSG